MKRWWQKMWAWKLRRDQRALQDWVRVRAGGRGRYVLRTTLLISAAMFTVHEIVGDTVGFLTIATALCSGVAISYFTWSDSEDRYKRALAEGRVNNAPSGILPEKPVLGLDSQ